MGKKELRRIQLGIMTAPGINLGFFERLNLVRDIRADEAHAMAFIESAIVQWQTTTGKVLNLNADGKEFNWNDFYEFLKWLIPLLIELFA